MIKLSDEMYFKYLRLDGTVGKSLISGVRLLGLEFWPTSYLFCDSGQVASSPYSSSSLSVKREESYLTGFSEAEIIFVH